MRTLKYLSEWLIYLFPLTYLIWKQNITRHMDYLGPIDKVVSFQGKNYYIGMVSSSDKGTIFISLLEGIDIFGKNKYTKFVPLYKIKPPILGVPDPIKIETI